MPCAEARDAGKFLIFLNEGLSFAGNFFRRNFYLESLAWCCYWFQLGSRVPFANCGIRSPNQIRTDQNPQLQS